MLDFEKRMVQVAALAIAAIEASRGLSPNPNEQENQ